MSYKLMMLKILSALALLSLMAGCATATATLAPALPTSAPTVDVQPSLDAARTQAVQTALANLTQTAPTATEVPPTATSVPPTSTPVATATPAATATAVPPTLAPTPALVYATLVPSLSPTPLGYACYVMDVSPKPADSLTVGSGFTGKWTVANTGTAIWPHTQTDIEYVSGEKLQATSGLVDLGVDVAPGGAYFITVNMVAPKYTGIYYTTWAIKYGDLTVCNLKMEISVVK